VFFFETIGAMVSGRVRWSCYVNEMQLRVEAQWAGSRAGLRLTAMSLERGLHKDARGRSSRTSFEGEIFAA
jgi:hypothetical protein